MKDTAMELLMIWDLKKSAVRIAAIIQPNAATVFLNTAKNARKKGEDNLTAKEYLQQARSLDMLINAKQDELYALRLTATSVSSPALGDKVKSGGTNNTMQIVDKIIALQEVINSEIDRLVELKAEMHERIKKVYNPQFITLLTDKYINGFTLEQIAERMDKSYETIRGWHGEALQVFRKENNML
jgi:hypothetical protein